MLEVARNEAINVEAQLSRKQLVVFARYPEPGQCKTRLIGELSAQQAADIQRSMTEHTLEQCRRFASQTPCDIHVWCTGNHTDAMRTLYGDDLHYHLQPDGDLGQRMRHAFESGFAAGHEQIVAIGTDCATLQTDLIHASYRQLNDHASVLAPAADGGYVLIGLSSPTVNRQSKECSLGAFFEQIDWGTSRVLTQSVERATQAGISLALLPEQRDVDHPADLEAWYATSSGVLPARPKLSIVIPTLHTEEHLGKCIVSAHSGILEAADAVDTETIIVATGDIQHSALLAAEHRCQFLQSSLGRALQMNLGARVARGDVLLFLHADTRLPVGYKQNIFAALESSNCVGGAFELAIDSHATSIRVVERLVQLRSRLFGLPYGDQALFVRWDAFKQLGGFPEMPIMEDYEFVRRLRRRGRIALCSSRVLTSARRWQKLGVVRTTAVNQLMIFGYHLGISPERLAKLYRRKRR